MIGTSEHGGTPHIGRNTRNTGFVPPSRGRFAALLAIPLLAIPLLCQYAPARAQDSFSTPTPYPAAVATATAAAQRMTESQNAKAHAAQQVQAAQAAQAAADAQFNAAQQAANEARALLASQQVAAASEALGRAEGAISAGQSRVGELAGIVDSLKATIDQQAAQISAMTIELQQARADKQTLLAAYEATQAKAAAAESRFYVNPAVAILAAGFLLAVLVVFVIRKWDREPVPVTADQPAIAGSYTVADEVIDDEPIEDRKDTTP